MIWRKGKEGLGCRKWVNDGVECPRVCLQVWLLFKCVCSAYAGIHSSYGVCVCVCVYVFACLSTCTHTRTGVL